MTHPKEAEARVKINKLLEQAGWRFADDERGAKNIRLEANVQFGALDKDLADAATSDGRRGAIDFLLLDKDGRALVVVEAKRESTDPLAAKEQARKYARNVGARFVILSNGNIHYLWDTKHGNPHTIARFPTQDSIAQYTEYTPDPATLAETSVDENYIVAAQMPNFAADPDFQNAAARAAYLKSHNLKQLRSYQVAAVKALQAAAQRGGQRFLFEMATGTGKTLISAAVIKLFLVSGNARRVLFLVDRLELEEQAHKAFSQYLGRDYHSVIYKESRDSWANANIVVSTIQTFLAGDRYKKEFSPTDFELVISDEAHRSIGGNSRAVFEYFVGYKLGLTATPKNYLRGFDAEGEDSQREYERRLLIDTYKTFGCEPGNPTFSYDLEKGATDGHLIKPTLVDVRTNITTQLLSQAGYAVCAAPRNGDPAPQTFNEKHYERRIFNEQTNVAMCKALIDNGVYDPVAGRYGVALFGKTIVFAVSQSHAARLTAILNEIAFKKWPRQYGASDFAMQISSQVANAQQMTVNFANNRLGGQAQSPEGYDTSKTRVAVTVGMMTTGYDCQDLLNIALMRPIFSPTDFVQIKGRGTRKWTFEYEDDQSDPIAVAKDKFKFFDFFAACEYFEKEFDYDEKIKLSAEYPAISESSGGARVAEGDDEQAAATDKVDLDLPDEIATKKETPEGVIMRIDREGFKCAVDEDVLSNATLTNLWKNGDTAGAEEFTKTKIFNNPKNYLNLDKIRQAFNVDRRITVKEFLEVVFGDKETFEMKDDLLESEWAKFMDIYQVDQTRYQAAKNFFKAYIVDKEVREIVATKEPARFNHCAAFDFSDYLKLNGYREIVPQYVQDYAYHLTNL